MSSSSVQQTSPKVKITQSALQIALEAREREIGSEKHGLWVELSEASGGRRDSSMYFRPVDEAASGDFVQSHDQISIVVPAVTVERLSGEATLFITSTVVEQGLGLSEDDDFEELGVLPSSPAVTAVTAGKDGVELNGDVAQRVVQVLNQQINPSIAVHGGRADLVAIEGDTAHLRLSGGCQGCGMASVTLSQGIEVALKTSVPEIQQVVDVTDHASGDNPFYEGSKK